MGLGFGLEEQVTLREYLEDPIFAAWHRKEPSLGRVVTFSGRPWRVFAQQTRNGKWAFRDFKSWKKALKFTDKLLEQGFHDAALMSKVAVFQPPIVRDKSLGLVKHAGKMVGKKRYHVPAIVGQHHNHLWCPHCRRPTVFTTFSRHHTFQSGRFLMWKRRCAICGIAMTAIKLYK
jgi:hypothetical protein